MIMGCRIPMHPGSPSDTVGFYPAEKESQTKMPEQPGIFIKLTKDFFRKAFPAVVLHLSNAGKLLSDPCGVSDVQMLSQIPVVSSYQTDQRI